MATNPVTPSQFCDAVPAANADFCTRFSKFLNVPQLLCDLFGWMLNADGTVSDDFKSEVAQFTAPTGTVVMSLTLNMGTAWILADGSEVSRTTYADLYTQIGTRYGAGNGTTTFTLPDLRSRSPIGAGQGSGLTNRDIATLSVGEERHTMTEAELATHRHAYSTDGAQQILVYQNTGVVDDITRNGSLNYAYADPMDTTGSSSPFNVVHPCWVGYYFIKT